ncbi:NADH dehydrogenase subunit A [Nitrosococcus oceani ATCC 19707]|uniref:NADH-quinone oxidoreductase subunit A n=2 Tax=Nitrosococcus oceani TaxID=1229 RepID=NUOA_NITOC|nr:NADH-quinone oxidoreductase subunit A [Nitrosococcus oceani]Q3JC15.1 RecName: Full=NADH-quinone oxidoreductase subunit A; AltName: Full=NADH dehydrogenase I subunit A; AltName: Full=NDH-1 subunit A; AltName: Full=NUO1 [Nitrosococcus oceani ATCC 19707]KFI19915.1 NADH:ubiquinone oxidoreductase subunit A [Nitrosococcus oceani C-27]ABA57631.1 NADH dehydrogenase subunit A [Nitrosococcus oceani ATCC 19707]EDZ66936.1 NADH-ubiquinone/plastoquinone oxidoreductase, chain 3 superfamily [Nitrosococcus o
MQFTEFWPFILYAGMVLVLVALIVGFSYILGQRPRERATDEPFESGVVTVGFARLRFPAKFYLVAVLFVIFDMEAAFIFAWAVAFRETGWIGYGGALAFITILGVALIYEWRVGALDWQPKGRKHKKHR